MKILISDKLAQAGIDILKQVEGFEVDCRYGLKPEELKKVIPAYDALVIRSGTKVTADIIQAADKLKVIGRAGVGLDNVDLKAATRKGIVAMNTPAGNTTSTAEQTMSLILALSRNVPQAYVSLKAGKWERSKFSGIELHGKTLGVIGLGRIGSTVAHFGKAFGMRVIAFDPYLSREVASQLGVEIFEFEDLLKEADFITIHTPKSSETKSLIADKEFALMKPNVRIINCARGGIVDEKALVKALQDKRIAGCALDVFEKEPPPPDSPLFQFDTCVTTPHLGASTSEAQINVSIEVAQCVRDALLGKAIINAANFPSVSPEAYKILAPYIDLAQRMGRFAGQLIHGRISQVNLTCSGIFTSQKNLTPISLALTNGLLSPILGETINSVNALEVAKDRGINIQEILSTKEEEFVNLVSAEITTDQERFTVWGTLSGNKQPRIVKVNQVYVEASPEGYMLFINNNDKPGIVGAVGTVLAEADINIAGITFGREAPGGLAISVVNVDSEVPEAILEKIRQTPNVLFVKLLKI